MDITELIARSEILSLLNRYARGVDRNDWPLVRGCYHADAHDDHGLYQGGVDGLMAFLQRTAALFIGTSHELGNHLAEIDGHQARAETSCVTWYRARDKQGNPRLIAQGVRYLDTLAQRDGRWAISQRVVVFDWEHVFDATHAKPVAAGWQLGARGAEDPSASFFTAALAAAASQPPHQERS